MREAVEKTLEKTCAQADALRAGRIPTHVWGDDIQEVRTVDRYTAVNSPLQHEREFLAAAFGTRAAWNKDAIAVADALNEAGLLDALWAPAPGMVIQHMCIEPF